MNLREILTGELKLAEAEINPPDVVKMDVPLFIRLLEYAREDAKTDMDLHNLTDRVIKLSTEGKTLDMSVYNSLVPAAKDSKY